MGDCTAEITLKQEIEKVDEIKETKEEEETKEKEKSVVSRSTSSSTISSMGTWITPSCCGDRSQKVSKGFVIFITRTLFTGILILFCLYMIAANDQNRELWIGLLVSTMSGYRQQPDKAEKQITKKISK